MDKRQDFLASMGTDTPFYHLFDCLPGISFFAKNRDFEIVCANQAFVERLGFRDESEIIGKTDFEIFPPQLAENFRRDDRHVIETGEPRLNIVELFFNRQGLPDWFLTNKLPVRDREGGVCGVMGTVQSYQHRKETIQPYLEIDRSVQYIRQHFRERIVISDLARLVHLSVRQLNRKFRELFQVSPQTFIMKLRVQAACEELRETAVPIAEIAMNLGFYDQSSFTMQFRRQMGTTPLKYRRHAQRRLAPPATSFLRP